MQDITHFAINSLFVVLALMLLPMAGFAQKPKEDPHKINITSYEILVQELKKPYIKIDGKGMKRSYTKVYIIKLKGYFGEVGAIPVDIFIGNYKVPEYGGTKDGIYFKVYEEKL